MTGILQIKPASHSDSGVKRGAICSRGHSVQAHQASASERNWGLLAVGFDVCYCETYHRVTYPHLVCINSSLLVSLPLQLLGEGSGKLA